MKFIADLHIHSHFSIATSKKLIPEYLEYWARIKGINLIGTGDCVHPGWSAELAEKLLPVENGLFKLKDEYQLEESKELIKKGLKEEIFFILTGEISSIYKKNGKTRKVHNLIILPDLDALHFMQAKLEHVGNIRSDGRPILGLDSRDLLDMVLHSSDKSFFIPAHIWTPWFSVLGSKSGFDSIEECFEDLTSEIFAVETGLSSDPPMNYICSFLDPFKMVSNSDAHSPDKLGREANLFDTELSYDGLYSSLKTGKGFNGTIEFFPQEGKYHYDGHRKCNVCLNPTETLNENGICPVCHRALTKGVMYRVAELADREDFTVSPNYRKYHSITQLPDIIAEIKGIKNSRSKGVQAEYHKIIANLGPEFHILLDYDIDRISQVGGEIVAEAISRLRRGDVIINEGYDGEFGRVNLFDKNELAEMSGKSLFSGVGNVKNKTPYKSIRFDIKEFQKKNIELKEKQEINENSSATEKKENNDKEQKLNLNQKQLDAVTFGNGPLVIVAGPGTGKTRVLIERIKFLIEEKNIAPQKILAITFTNRAASEMQERLLSLKTKEEQPTIATFHKLGLLFLKEFHTSMNLNKDFFVADEFQRSEILLSLKKGSVKTLSAYISKIKSFDVALSHNDEFDDIFDEYNSILQKRNMIDVDDLLYLPATVLFKDKEILLSIQKKYDWILVDEFQDLNNIQFQFLLKIIDADNPNVMIIGDPEQSIYGFRGGAVKFFDEFKNYFKDTTEIFLEKSYRCPQNILDFGNEILSKNRKIIGTNKSSDIIFYKAESGADEADWIAETIEISMGGVRSFSMDSGISDGTSMEENVFGDFAVLCRSSLMFDDLERAFNNHGISYQKISSGSLFFTEKYYSVFQIIRAAYYRDNYYSDNLFYVDIQMMFKDEVSLSKIFKFLMEENKFSPEDVLEIEYLTEIYGKEYEDFFNSVSLISTNDRFEKRPDAVSLLTIHAAKGLEFKNVFIPGLEDGLIPFSLFAKNEDLDLEEEKRVFYVGLTRSFAKLFLSNAKQRFFKNRPLKNKQSSLLKNINQKMVNFINRAGKSSKKKVDKEVDQLKLF